MLLAFFALFFLILVRQVALPFVAGMALAYFLDPPVDKLETFGLSRTLSAVIVAFVFVLAVLSILAMVGPLLVNQSIDLLNNLPGLLAAGREQGLAFLDQIGERYQIDARSKIREHLGSFTEQAINTLIALVLNLIQSGVALVNIISLFLITPLVGFFCLLRWDRIVASVDALLPLPERPAIRTVAKDIDRALAGFVRGQALVCLIMATYYALALTLSGLQYGAAVGLVAGILTFIPYIGALTGFLLTVTLSFIQFPDLWSILLPIGFFLLGQSVEGNILTPRLVGRGIGLHDVWVLFAVLAGGAIAGFLGVLVAVPVAAMIGVAVRHAVGRYRKTRYYLGEDEDPPPGQLPKA
ncbi:MAG: AI-2E family transporter [Rhodospirillales bacterium]|nr:AI-2E family transporter [Rhodospirillales bacterium]